MAHMIDSLTYTGEVPWHGLGRRLPEHVTVDEAIRFGGLDWQVIPRPLTQFNEAAIGASVPGWKALTRSDRPEVTLAVVPESQGIIQNREALGLIEAAVGTGQACAEVCGSLDEGRKVFLVAKVSEAGFELAPGDRVDTYLLAYTGHGQDLSCTVRFTPTRVVCANTLAIAIGQETPAEIRIRHTRNAAERVAFAHECLKAARSYFGAVHERVLRLVNQRLTLTAAMDITERLFPARQIDGRLVTPAAQGKVLALLTRQHCILADARYAGTKMGYFQALTAYLDHNTRRAGGAEGAMKRAIAGANTDLRTKAVDLLLAA